MIAYVAMLRGINVSGKNLIKMENLCASFEAMGLNDVKTYVQSGNVIFKAERETEGRLEQKITKKILHDFGFNVSVIVRTSNEMQKVAKANPFLKNKSVDVSKLHVTFLSELPTKTALAKLETLPSTSDEFQVLDREIYLHCPNGYGNTKLSNNVFEKRLDVSATTRNWKTVNALVEMLGG